MKKIIFAAVAFCILLHGGLILSAPDSGSMFTQGIDALRSGNYSAAELIFRRLSSDNNGDIGDKSLFYLAQSIFYQKNYKSALHEFTNYLAKCKTNSLCLETRYWIGESYYYQKQYANAIEEYKRYLDKNSKEYFAPFAHDRIGSIYYEQERYTEAIEEWEYAINLSKDKKANDMRTLNICRSLFLNNQYDEALNMLNPLLAHNVDAGINASARIVCGRIYQSKDKHRQALGLFNGIPEDMLKLPLYCEARYFKALSLINLGDIAGAKAQLEIFLIIAANNRWYYYALYELGKLNIKTGETAKGLEQLNTVAVSAAPKLKSTANRYLGNYYLPIDTNKAAPYLEAAMSGSDDDRDVKLSLADVYIREQRPDEAEKILTEYRAAYPYDSHIDKVKFLMARICLLRGDNEQAMKLFESIRREDPFSEYINETDLYLAEAAYNNGNYQKSISLLNSYLQKNSIGNRYEGIKLLAACYIEIGSLNVAQVYINQIVNNYINGGGADSIICRFAVAYYDAGGNGDWYINKVRESHPDSSALKELYLSMGDLAFKKGKYKVAADYYDKYMQTGIKKNQGVAFFNTALCLFNLGQYSDVLAMLSSNGIPPLDEEQWIQIPFIRARCYGQTKEYTRIYTLFLPTDTPYMPDDIFHLYMKSAAAMGDMGLIQNNMERLSRNSAACSDVLIDMATWYKSQGNEAKAAACYSDIIGGYPNATQADTARLEYAKMLISKNKHGQAVSYLTGIRSETLREEKNALLILSYFETGDTENAAKLSDAEIYRLASGPYGKDIIKKNIMLRYEQKQTQAFNRYIYFLQNNAADSNDYANYIQGKYYMELKDYRTAFAMFARTAATDNEYTIESLFILGEISLLVNKNFNMAADYFSKVAEKSRHSDYGCKAMLELALIYGETSRIEEAKMILKDIIKTDAGKIYAIQAENIYNALQSGLTSDAVRKQANLPDTGILQ